METNTNATPEVALEAIITNAVKLPLVKVDRDSFLAETFASTSLPLSDVLKKAPSPQVLPEKCCPLCHKNSS